MLHNVQQVTVCFKVFTEITVLWGASPCSLVDKYRCFGGTPWLHPLYYTMRRHIPEDSDLSTYCHEKLRTYIKYSCFLIKGRFHHIYYNTVTFILTSVIRTLTNKLIHWQYMKPSENKFLNRNNFNFLTSDILRATNVNIIVFWDTMPCGLVNFPTFGGTSCL